MVTVADNAGAHTLDCRNWVILILLCNTLA